MEAIEYLKGKENKELNDVIILIIKEFLGISEKEAIEKESNKKVEKDIKIKQYNYFKAEINNKIYIVIKNGKTVIITKIDKSKEKEVNQILKEFNYIL